MSRTLFTLLPLLSCFSAIGQGVPYDSTRSKHVYTDIINLHNLDKSTIFSLANQWFAKAYRSSSDVIQLNDKEAGKIIGKGSMSIMVEHRYNNMKTPVHMQANYTISVDVKNEKLRYTITDFYMKSQNVETPLEEYSISKDEIKKVLSSIISGASQLDKRSQEQLEFDLDLHKQVDSHIRNIIASLTETISTNSNNDW